MPDLIDVAPGSPEWLAADTWPCCEHCPGDHAVRDFVPWSAERKW